jgi:predicted ribosomally synthesized peptide with nif11-like leader
VSIEQARLFIERVHRDDAFRERVLAEHDVDARMELIRGEGFDCTAEEIAGVLVVLADAMLDSVVGGGATQGPSEDMPTDWDPFHPN